MVLPLFVPDVAVMVTVPVLATRAFTTPFCVTVARVSSLLDHTIGADVNRPSASKVDAFSCHALPTSTAMVSGTIATDATGAAAGTMIVAVPFTPPLVAVIVACPARFGVRYPAVETMATFESDDVQVMARSTRMKPAESRTTALT